MLVLVLSRCCWTRTSRSTQGSTESMHRERFLAVWHEGKAAKDSVKRQYSRVLLGTGVALQREADPLLGRITVVVERLVLLDMYM